MLNDATKSNHYPLPFVDDILHEVAGYESYGVCDGYSGYFQIAIAEEDHIKTTFITPWVCFHYKVIPFGMKNAPSWYHENTDRVLTPFIGKFVRAFLDDICVYSSKKEHASRLE